MPRPSNKIRELRTALAVALGLAIASFGAAVVAAGYITKAKSAFPVHSILSLTSSTAITTVTLFGGRHAGSALHLTNHLKPAEFGAVSRKFSVSALSQERRNPLTLERSRAYE